MNWLPKILDGIGVGALLAAFLSVGVILAYHVPELVVLTFGFLAVSAVCLYLSKYYAYGVVKFGDQNKK